MEIFHLCAWLQDSPWLEVGVRWGLRKRKMKAEENSGKWGRTEETRSVEQCGGVRHTWMGGYTIPIWRGAARGSWVSWFPAARLPASGLGSLNAFDSSGMAIPLVVRLSLALQGWRRKWKLRSLFI